MPQVKFLRSDLFWGNGSSETFIILSLEYGINFAKKFIYKM